MDDEKIKTEKDDVPDRSGRTTPWAAVIIIGILSQMFWWFMFASPFLGLFEKLVKALDRISPP